jgi:2-desacetyl-2-hydroxyethyl bacteriochlorophyllide A dehydrogenase
MKQTYRAVYLAGPAAFEIKEVQVPEKLPAGYFMSDINYCAICGSDNGFWQAAIKKNVMGHEICATITDPGDTGLKVGDRVCMYPGIPCWNCEACKQGNDNICTTIYYNGYTGLSADGGYAEKYMGPAAYAYKVPGHVSSEAASLVEPLATAVHAVRQSNLKVGGKVLVIGAGPIGIYCAEVAKHAGASMVVISEYNAGRLALAQKIHPFDGYFDASDPEVNDKLRKVSGAAAGKGDGFDVVFECAASEGGYATAAAAAKSRGQVIMVGLKNKPLGIVPQVYALKELTITPSMAYTLKDFEQALELISSGAIDPAKIVTKIVTIDELQGAFDHLFKDPANTDLKILLNPNK